MKKTSTPFSQNTHLKHDKQRWDARYIDPPEDYPAPDTFLTQNSSLLYGGRAIDIACGLCANAIYLSQRNYRVDAVDISENALRRAQKKARSLNLDIGFIVSDIDYFPIPENIYDLALVFYFFSAKLIPAITTSVRRGGLIIYSTFNYRHTSLKPDFNPEYLVPKGGLAQYFNGARIIVDEPEAGTELNLSRLIAQRT